jgi:hypothetical protein
MRLNDTVEIIYTNGNKDFGKILNFPTGARAEISNAGPPITVAVTNLTRGQCEDWTLQLP